VHSSTESKPVNDTLELLASRDGDRVRLSSPEVGWFTRAQPLGYVLSSGEPAGVLLALGRSITLVVPHDVSGVVTSPAPERVRMPVAYGDVLYELAPLEAAKGSTPRKSTSNSESKRDAALVMRSSQSGRFYQRPAPGEPAFVSIGQEIADGAPVGLIEVMKTFNHVVYRSSAGLPPRARVNRFVAGDGADVKQGDVLIELEAV
jgi:acetyl-CoA carboxylase biotin carboxyl carrier protein